ncbi:tail fiber domain-containing protein [Morganella morganii]|uniref:tail fiber/spike domain-containing protein n=1 Tax=Morganella morganii TaxID=582 RepID=UPI000CE2974F|nr:tail fiber domain-containing protein [Morganella morganii]AVD59196.1 hypothetical protein C4E49_07105 [Morganella morganii]MBT0428269.1 tail fiber domain-containing protein [Morganella morganii subsp. morganii]MBT0522820.1 tail fiber domain-containing protein [Morganella morganii subsp. morganii]QWM19607.1 tail fiber domain-containing protein [Morganella morganii subsp. morganii]HCB2931688.1 tail fiber domain-containing protein [Morganella morganii]
MATIPTQNAVPSEAPRDLKFNSGKIDEFVTSLEHEYKDRFGRCHLTIEGMKWMFYQLIERFKVDINQAIIAAGYIPIDSFQLGAEITKRNEILRDETTGEYYRWDGDLPKSVPAGATPESSGGVGVGKWVGVGDASLRSDLKRESGASHISFEKTDVYKKLSEILTITDFGALAVAGVDNAKFISLMMAEKDVVIPPGVFEIRADITFNRNVIFLPDSTLKLIGDITLTFERDIVAPNCQIFDLSLGGHIVVAGDYDAPGVTEINPYWFAHDDTGWSQIIRGRNAGTQAIHNRSKINYSHIDGFRACEKTESAIEHTAVGCFAGASLIDSYLSTAVGYGALRGKEDPPSSGVFRGTKASETTAIGQGALQDGIEHTSSTAIGSGAGNGAYKSTNAVVIGTNAARIADALNNTVVIGTGAAYKWGSDGEHGNNVVIGANACNLVVRGNQNTIIGSIAGNQCTESTSNTWVGHQTGPESSEFSAVSNAICIGDSARTRAGNTITVGNSITNTSDGRTIIGNNATTDCQIRGIYNTTTASGSNVYVDTLGFLFRSTSSKKYKKDIEPYDLEWAYKVLEFEPIVYKPTENAANPDWTYYGYIAEQVAKVDPRYTHMEINDGVSSPSGVMYERIVVAQGMIIKDLLDRVDALESNKK